MADERVPRFRGSGGLTELGPALGFREGTRHPTFKTKFFFTESGLGDYICFTSAIRWLAKNSPWLEGELYLNAPMVPLFAAYLADCPSWQVLPGERVTLSPGEHFVGPGIILDGKPLSYQYLNPTGAHLVDLGFAWFAGLCPAPAGATYPFLTQPEEQLLRELRGKRGKYIVFTPGSVTSSRRVEGRHLNPLITFARERGLEAVVLGRSAPGTAVDPYFPADLSWGEVTDLRDRTDLLGAAAVMEHAACVIGLDNGLLHLAASTPATVIFGYSITGPRFRGPRRDWGRTYDITLEDSELACNHCQDKWKHLLNHSFHKCYYGDARCIDLLFADGAARWKSALKEILDGGAR